jgi:hypothetical protein
MWQSMRKFGFCYIIFLDLILDAGLVATKIRDLHSQTSQNNLFLMKSRVNPRTALLRLKGSGENTQQADCQVKGPPSRFLGTAAIEKNLNQSNDSEVVNSMDSVIKFRFHEILYSNTNSEGVGVDFLGHIVHEDGPAASEITGQDGRSDNDPESHELDALASRAFRAMERFAPHVHARVFEHKSSL